MTTVTALPTPPTRADAINFATRADEFLAALPTFGDELNTVAGEVNTNAANALAAYNNAAASAAAALASETAATYVASAALWVSGTSYTIGQCTFSPTDYQTYRRKTNGAGTTDPVSDSTNWERIGVITAIAGATKDASDSITIGAPYWASTGPTLEGAQIGLTEGMSNTRSWVVDVYTSSGVPGFRIVDVVSGNCNLLVDKSNQVQVGGVITTAPTAPLDINGNRLRIRTQKTPASASDTGLAGEYCNDANYLYICTATNTWKRIALSTW